MSRTIPQWIKDAKPRYCAACGKETDLQYHHLVPVLLGGKTEPNNIIVLCGVCHQKWHDQKGADHHNHHAIDCREQHTVQFGQSHDGERDHGDGEGAFRVLLQVQRAVN